jgi:hypothetical protein
MDLRVKGSRNREELAADLAELALVDWAQVWPGYSHTDPRMWCAQRGWTLTELDRVENIWVRLGSGGRLYLRQARDWANPTPVISAALDCWRANVQSPADNGALFTTADSAWSDYVAGASETIGRPALVTSFDDPRFPDHPDWPVKERALWRIPYRLALWSFNGASAHLYVGPSGGAITTNQRGGIQISLLLRPADVAEQVRGV